MLSRSRGPRVPQLLDDAAGWGWRLLVVGGSLYVLGALALRLHLVVIPLLTALLLTTLLSPVSNRLRAWGVPRSLAALLTMLLALAVLGGVGTYVVSRAAAQYPALVDQISTLVDRSQHWLETGPLRLGKGNVDTFGSQLVDSLRSRQGQVAHGVLSAGRTVLDVVTGMLLTFFMTIFLLYDGPRIWAWLTGLFAESSRARVDLVGERMWRTLSGYVSGTFIVALFHGLAMGVTLAIVGVPLVAPLAVLVFLGSFIPLIGVVVFGGLAVLVTLVAKGPTTGLVVLVVLVVENQIESHVLQPFVVGRHVRLHPLAIAVTLASGAILAGLPGAIFAVPLVASVNAAAVALRPPREHVGAPSAADVEAERA